MASSNASAAGPAGAADHVAAAHDKLLHTPGLQFDFDAVPPPPEMPEWLAALFKFIGTLQPLFEILFWAGVAILVGLILYFVGREALRYYMSTRPNARTAPERAPDWWPPAARARALLADVDRLAAQGLFAEAVHLLLFRSIEDIDVHRPRALKPALTSRDIVALKEIPAAARQAFARITAAVEWSFFAGRSVTVKDFAECRSAYEAFAFPDAWNEGRA
jgi:hypothetical protein